jgi:hypothetical protein
MMFGGMPYRDGMGGGFGGGMMGGGMMAPAPWMMAAPSPPPPEHLIALLRAYYPADYHRLTEHCVIEYIDVPTTRATGWSGKDGGQGIGIAATNKGALYKWVRNPWG